MNVKTEVIVLNRIKYTDSSHIASIYSLEHGRLSVMLRIPKTSKANVKPGLFFPLNLLEAEIIYKNSRSVQNIKHCNSLFPIYSVCSDIYKITLAQFIAEVISKCVREQEPNEEMFNFIKGVILELERTTASISNIHILFLKDFATYLGFAISNNISEETPYFNIPEGMFLPVFTKSDESLDEGDSALLSGLLDMSFENIEELSFTYKERTKLLSILIRYLRHHVESFGELKSLKVLHEVFVG